MTDVAWEVESDLDAEVEAWGWEDVEEAEGTSRGGKTGRCDCKDGVSAR